MRRPIKRILQIDENHLNAYSTGLLQGKAYRALSAHLTRALFPFELSMPEWKMLGLITERGEMKLAALADLLDVRAPLVTKMIDALEKKKLVLRRVASQDERIRLVTPTEKGRRLVPRAEKAVKDEMRLLLSGVSRENLLVYLRVLTAIVDNSTTSR